MYAAFVDLEKAYDKVDRETLEKFMIWEGSYWKEIRLFIGKQLHLRGWRGSSVKALL